MENLENHSLSPPSSGPESSVSASFPTLQEVLSTAAPSPPEVPCVLLWGPISLQESSLAGARFPTSSVLLKPQLPDGIAQAALKNVPLNLFPRSGDTPETLCERIAASSYIENSHVLKGGNGPQRVALKTTTYPQPRRRSLSVQIDSIPSQVSEGSSKTTLFNYSAFGRAAADWEAYLMPRAVFKLGAELWRAAFPFLTEHSRRNPPTACQLLFYYVLFNSSMGRHRDKYTGRQLADVMCGKRTTASLLEGSHHGGDANSQVVGSNVLIYTEGDADMTFSLSFPPCEGMESSAKEYIQHPSFCTKLGAGTLLVFSPVDDLFFCHEVYFEDSVAGTHRLAFVFRWLSQPRSFCNATGKMLLSPALAQAALLKKKRRKKDSWS